MTEQQRVPIPLHVVKGPEQGLQCWEPEGAVRLRRDHRLLGTLIGGVSQFKNQNAVNGLPMLLGPAEAALAVQGGWATVHPPSLKVMLEEEDGASAVVADPSKRRRTGSGRQGGRNWLQDGSAEYFAYYERLGAYGSTAQRHRLEADNHSLGMHQQRMEQQQQHQQHQQQTEQPQLQMEQQQQQQQRQEDLQGCVEAFNRACQPHHSYRILPQPDATPTSIWKRALTDGENFQIPVHASAPGHLLLPSQQHPNEHQQMRQEQPQNLKQSQMREQCSGGVRDVPKQQVKQQDDSQQLQSLQQHHPQRAPAQLGQCGPESSQPLLPLNYPSDPSQAMRFGLFKDLHAQGYALSAGPKFGADLLAYPGDPCLFHAQFTIRVVEPGLALCPTALKASVRGSHAARKHLLLASMLPPKAGTSADGDAKQQPFYISIGPETGFGHSK